MKLAEEILREVLKPALCFYSCFCYCFLSIYSEIPVERNDFNPNCSSKKKSIEGLETPQTVCIERMRRPGRGDQGARKHMVNPHIVV